MGTEGTEGTSIRSSGPPRPSDADRAHLELVAAAVSARTAEERWRAAQDVADARRAEAVEARAGRNRAENAYRAALGL